MEFRRGGRVRFTRNDPALGPADGEAATVEIIGKDGVRFLLENGPVTGPGRQDPAVPTSLRTIS